MARMIDGDAVTKRLRAWLESPHGENVYNSGYDDAIWHVLDVIEHMPTLTQPNEPLTFVERREMDRKPVWLDDEKTFGILQFWDDNNVDAVFLDSSGCICAKSVIGKKIYRRPPEGVK